MSLELEAPGVAGWESVLATGEREAGSWRGSPGCSELLIRSTMLDKQSRLDKELLSVAYTKDTRGKKNVKKKKKNPIGRLAYVALWTAGQLLWNPEVRWSQRPQCRNLQHIYLAVHGGAGGEWRSTLGNVLSKSSCACMCAWEYLWGEFWADVYFAPPKSPCKNHSLFLQITAWKDRLIWWAELWSWTGL